MAAPATTRIDTRESELRAATGDAVFDAVVMLDTTGRREADAALATARAMLETALPIQSVCSAVYDLAYRLAAGEVG